MRLRTPLLQTAMPAGYENQDNTLASPGSSSSDEGAKPTSLEVQETSSSPKRDSRFWLVFLANLLVDFLPALDLVSDFPPQTPSFG